MRRLVYLQYLVVGCMIGVVIVNLGSTQRADTRQDIGWPRPKGTKMSIPPAEAPLPYNPESITISKIPSYRNSTTMPLWMQEYLDWHRAADLNPRQYLIVRCTRPDTKCGGTADRLKPLPLYVALAHQMQRHLLVHWQGRPCALEHFLVPHDVDWRVPTRLLQNVHAHTERAHLRTRRELLPWVVPHMRSPTLPKFAYIVYQSQDHGAELYQQLHPNESAQEVFVPLWKAFFRPSPPVEARIHQTQRELHLKPNHYVGVHIRSQYHSINGPKMLRILCQHAMDCASLLRSSADEPFYVATDDPTATRHALEHAMSHGARAVSRTDPILHLDRGTSFLAKNSSAWTTHPSPSAYYATFVDLYLLAQASCRSVNVGNYGKWANLLADDPVCLNNHLKLKRCVWKNFTTTTQ